MHLGVANTTSDGNQALVSFLPGCAPLVMLFEHPSAFNICDAKGKINYYVCGKPLDETHCGNQSTQFGDEFQCEWHSGVQCEPGVKNRTRAESKGKRKANTQNSQRKDAATASTNQC